MHSRERRPSPVIGVRAEARTVAPGSLRRVLWLKWAAAGKGNMDDVADRLKDGTFLRNRGTEIGRGGFSVVYHTRLSANSAPLALKVLSEASIYRIDGEQAHEQILLITAIFSLTVVTSA